MSESDRVLDYGGEEVEAAAEQIRKASALRPRAALILGSGLGRFIDHLEQRESFFYGDLPGFPQPTVAGHTGNLVLGTVDQVPVVVQQGRFHVYEGVSAGRVVFPLRVMAALGAGQLIVTNAAGGANPEFKPGNLMIIDDLVNFQFRSALRGRGPLVDEDRFVDLKDVFSPRLKQIARETAVELRLQGIREGTYWGNSGPAYETRAEVAMARSLGADALGMSTVPEAVAAAHLGMETLGISVITNAAAGLSAVPLSHSEVLETADAAQKVFDRWVRCIVSKL